MTASAMFWAVSTSRPPERFGGKSCWPLAGTGCVSRYGSSLSRSPAASEPPYSFAPNGPVKPFSFAISERSGRRKNGIWSSPPPKTTYLTLGRAAMIASTSFAIALATAFAAPGSHGLESQVL